MINQLVCKEQSQFSVKRFCSRFVTLTMAVMLMVGCSMQSSQEIPTYDAAKGADYYLSMAEKSRGDTRTSWQLLAIRALLAQNQLVPAQRMLNSLPSGLSNAQQNDRLLSLAELAVRQRHSVNLSQLADTNLSTEQKQRLYRIKVIDAKNRMQPADVLRSYIALERFGTQADRRQAIDETWQYLATLSPEQVNSLSVFANEYTLQGWLDLYNTYQNAGGAYYGAKGTPEEEAHYQRLRSAIAEWQIQYADNPAARYLPRTIYGDSRRLPENTVGGLNVALFLPLSGSSKVYGETIAMGYQDASRYFPSDRAQNVQVYDTGSNTIANLVQQARQDGMTMIVGPLLKKNVTAIEQMAPDLPVLALNRINDAFSNNAANICYFALSPEDEAASAARHIFAQNKRQPLLFVPNGELGQRVARAFEAQWANLTGGQPAYVQYFGSVAALSEQMNRGQGLKLVGKPIQGYMDADISLLNEGVINFDAIYIVSTQAELNYIRPMLVMQPVGEEGLANSMRQQRERPLPPIYASSRSNTAIQHRDYRLEMDRMQFSEIPLIATQPDLFAQLPSYLQRDYSLVRLYAMGIDAWRLANHFNELKSGQAPVTAGLTGNLSVGNGCQIIRDLPWLAYRQGTLQQIN